MQNGDARRHYENSRTLRKDKRGKPNAKRSKKRNDARRHYECSRNKRRKPDERGSKKKKGGFGRRSTYVESSVVTHLRSVTPTGLCYRPTTNGKRVVTLERSSEFANNAAPKAAWQCEKTGLRCLSMRSSPHTRSLPRKWQAGCFIRTRSSRVGAALLCSACYRSC